MKKSILLLFAFSMVISTRSQYLELTPKGFINVQDPALGYVVLDIPGKGQGELYKSILTYLNTVYNSPDNVLSVVDNEQIVVNGLAQNKIKDPHVPIYYSLDFRFKDGKVRVDMPFIDMVRRIGDGKSLFITLERKSLLGVYGIWTKGKLRFPEAKASLEHFFNDYIDNIVSAAKTKDDW